MFDAILIEKTEGASRAILTGLEEARLPAGDVTVRVAYSTLNYKDALAITGQAPVVRHFPMVPGIDFAGTVEHSDNPAYAVGDQVVLNGWGVGETHWGGLAGKARVKGDWLVPLQAPFTPRQAMAIGTAGYTAMLCVMALERHGVAPGQGEVLVTGAAGGVGSVAVALLAKLGHQVVAMTGRPEEAPFLRALGAAEVIDRAGYAEPGKPLARERWAGAVDVVGGQVLANICAAMRYRGTVAACGLAGGILGRIGPVGLVDQAAGNGVGSGHGASRFRGLVAAGPGVPGRRPPGPGRRLRSPRHRRRTDRGCPRPRR